MTFLVMFVTWNTKHEIGSKLEAKSLRIASTAINFDSIKTRSLRCCCQEDRCYYGHVDIKASIAWVPLWLKDHLVCIDVAYISSEGFVYKKGSEWIERTPTTWRDRIKRDTHILIESIAY